MAWFESYLKGSGGGGGDINFNATEKFGSVSSGSDTYTIEVSGLYFLVVGTSYMGTVSITLPAGKTAIYSKTISITNRTLIGTIVNLEQGDTITLTGINGGWNALIKKAYLLEGLTPSGEPTGGGVADSTYDFSADASTYSLTFGVALSKGAFSTEAYLGRQSTVITEEKFAFSDDRYVAYRLSFEKGGIYRFYAYDGGLAAAISFPISKV